MIELSMVGIWQFILICIPIITLIALIDVMRNEFKESNKLIWILVILFTNLIGVLLYLIFGTSQKMKPKREHTSLHNKKD